MSVNAYAGRTGNQPSEQEGVPMDEAWKEFFVSGKVTDYLRYKDAESERMSGVFHSREERPDGTEYRSDRDGLKCNADWRV